MSENKARIVRTITDLGYAPINAVDDDGKPTYGAVKWLPHHRAGGRSYDAQPAGTATGIWADGKKTEGPISPNGKTIKVLVKTN